MLRNFLIASAACLALGSAALAQAEKPQKPQPEVKPITIGDPARPIDIEYWVKGNKVASFEPGKIYVLEFWATWCGPCRQSMPHLTKLQQDYKDYNVSFISVSDEDLATVKDFLAKTDKASGKTWNEIIGYNLTTDPDESVKNDYFRAAGQNGIPCAFIIGKDSKIEWIGNPHPQSPDGFDKALEAVVKDSWDRDAYKAKWEKEQAAEREAMKSQKELRTAMAAKDWDKVMSLLDAQIAADQKSLSPKIQKFMIMAGPMNQPEKAYAYGNEIAKDNWDEAMLLNQLAWFTVDSKDVKTRDYDFALRLAERANELTTDKDPAILDTLARVYFDKGDLQNAVATEKKAAANAQDDQMGQEIKQTLKKYEDAAKKGTK